MRLVPVLLLLDVDATGAGVQFQARSAAIYRAAEFALAHRPLDRQREFCTDGTGTGAGHQGELRRVGQANTDPTGAGVDVPIANLLTIRLDASTAGMCLQFTGNVLETDITRAGLEVEVGAAGGGRTAGSQRHT